MSDNTMRDEERIDDWSATAPASKPTAAAAADTSQAASTPPGSAERVGFCQNCGRPLTRETLRSVGSGVFCEPCLEARVTGYAQAATPPAGAPPPYAAVPPIPAAPGDPSPFLAGLLGIIPGVGAMYNGQFAKGVVHLVVFAVLISLADNVNGVFGIFVFGWVVYQAFEAYHTAIARRDGLPLPNAFGFNDIGERMGFGKNWGVVGHARPNPVPPAAATSAPPPTASAAAYAPAPVIPVGTSPDWVGYVPPTAFASAPYASPYTAPAAAQYDPYAAQAYAAQMAQQVRDQANRDAGVYGAAPYAETYTGGPGYPAGPAATPIYGAPMPPAGALQTRRFPVGAIWLIALGALILIGNLIPDWRLSGRWVLPVIFAGLAAWTLMRRLRTGVSVVCLLRWPVILTVLAVLFALQAAYVATLGQTWPILFIALGAVLLLERTAGASSIPVAAAYTAPASGYVSVVPTPDAPTAEESPARAAWTEGDPPKGGQ